MFRSGNPELKLVSITFDDGPDPKFRPRILNILKEYEILTTFFVIETHVEANLDIAKRIVMEGHDIGNHTYSHQSLIPVSMTTIYDESDTSMEEIQE